MRKETEEKWTVVNILEKFKQNKELNFNVYLGLVRENSFCGGTINNIEIHIFCWENEVQVSLSRNNTKVIKVISNILEDFPVKQYVSNGFVTYMWLKENPRIYCEIITEKQASYLLRLQEATN